MHEDTRLAFIALGIGTLITGIFLALGRPLFFDIQMLAGITLGVVTFLALKHWGHRRSRRKTTDDHLKEIRHLAASTDYLADDPADLPDGDPARVRPRQQAG